MISWDEYKEEAPYCAYTIKYNNVDISERGTLSAKCDYDVFVETIKTMKNVESVTTSRFEANTIKRDKII